MKDSKRKYYIQDKRYGAIFCRWGQRKDGKPIRDVEIAEFTDSHDELLGIEEIFVDFCKGMHKPKNNSKNEEPSVMYGYAGYILVDYKYKTVIREYKDGVGFGGSNYRRLCLKFWLFATEEERQMAKTMSWPEFIGWLRFKYGDGRNAVDYDGKPEGSEELYKEAKRYEVFI